MSGIVDKIYVDFNSTVKKGQVIAEMDKVTLKAELQSQEASLAKAKAEYDYRVKSYNREKALHDKQLISDADFDDATYTYESVRAAYLQAQASMVKIRQNFAYAIITSPIDGVVISRDVEAGQTVASGFSTPTLFTIANDLTQMRVIADVDEADIGGVEEGQRVEFAVDAYPNDVFDGKVTQVRLQASTESSVVTYEVVISAYNPDLKLKPGLTANVSIFTMERSNVLVVPAKSLRFVPDAQQLEQSLGLTVDQSSTAAPQGKKMVWQNVNGVLRAKAITVGVSSGSVVEVIDGLTDGDEVITEMQVLTPKEVKAAEQSPFMPQRPGGKK